MGKFIDLTGQKFGRLVVIERTENVGRQVMWKCQCDCGNITITSSSHLKSGHTQSCGCLQRERTSESCKKDLTGKKFGRLTVIQRISKMGEKALYKCICDCGNIVTVDGGNLVTNSSTSCGCLRKELTAKLKLSHGQWGSRIYRCWRNMIDRCENDKNKEFKNYGGRDISVCKEWKSFENFYNWAMENGYEEHLTIDRIDVNGNYEPSNCKWSTLYEQARNRTDNVNISFQGKTMILEDWANETGICSRTIRNRLNKDLPIEQVFSKNIPHMQEQKPSKAERQRDF